MLVLYGGVLDAHHSEGECIDEIIERGGFESDRGMHLWEEMLTCPTPDEIEHWSDLGSHYVVEVILPHSEEELACYLVPEDQRKGQVREWIIPAYVLRGCPAKLLSTEAPGILNWLLRGFAEWQRHGLGEAAAVSEATKKYRAEEDVLGAFLQDRCEPAPEALEKPQELYDAYTDWCSQKDREPVNSTVFGRRLTHLGYEKVRPGDIWMRKGLRLRPEQM